MRSVITGQQERSTGRKFLDSQECLCDLDPPPILEVGVSLLSRSNSVRASKQILKPLHERRSPLGRPREPGAFEIHLAEEPFFRVLRAGFPSCHMILTSPRNARSGIALVR